MLIGDLEEDYQCYGWLNDISFSIKMEGMHRLNIRKEVFPFSDAQSQN